MATTQITIDVMKDLETLSDLKALFTGQGTAMFSVGAEIAKYAGQPIQSAVGSSPVELTLQGAPNWKTSSGIAFSLSADASCTIAISDKSTKFSVAQSIDDPTHTTDIVAGPTDGMVYVNIELDFDIKGSLSGSGTLSGIGIAGKASGSGTATLSYCQPVSATLETVAALKAAFSGLFFPFEPDCALSMPVGSIGKVNFDGSLNCELDVTYGLGSYKLSAQDFGLTQGSVKVAWEKLTPPSVNVDAGAKASVAYNHKDNFSAIVQKTDTNTALLYLLRSAANETKETVGITVGVSATSVSATVDPTQLTNTITQVTGGGSSTLANDVATYVTGLQSNLVSKANTWLSNNKGDAGLMLSLSQQSGSSVLFNFRIDLSSVPRQALATQSWAAFVSGDLQKARQIGGFTLLPGSGVSESLKHSSSIQLHFFNLFKLGEDQSYFTNSVTRLAADGSIQFFADIGEEELFTINKATASATIHFVATASDDTKGNNFLNTEVDLCIELSEANNPQEANKIASSIGSIAANATVHDAQTKMLSFVANNKSKTLTLKSIFKPSAYQKLACSPYTLDQHGHSYPPALPQEQDQDNWYAFQAAVETLVPELSFVSSMAYPTWMLFNVKSNYGTDADLNSGVPDRRNEGDPDPAAQHLFNPLTVQDWQIRAHFLLGTAEFMNLCDDVSSLAAAVAKVGSPGDWKSLINTLEGWVGADAPADWSKPALNALLSLSSIGTNPNQVSTDFQQSDSGFVCTLTLS